MCDAMERGETNRPALRPRMRPGVRRVVAMEVVSGLGDGVFWVGFTALLLDRNIGAAGFSATFGKGRILFHTIPGLITGMVGEPGGIHPVMAKRLVVNSLRYLGGGQK